MLTADHIVAAQKANLETLFDLTGKAFEGVEKLVELNLQVAKASLGEAAETAKSALAAKDAQALLALQSSLLQPAAEKAAAYSRHVYDIAAATNAEVTRVAEAQFADAQSNFVRRRRRRQERAGRHRVRRRAGEVRDRRRQQRDGDRPEGRQAGHRRRRSELPGDVVDGGSRY